MFAEGDVATTQPTPGQMVDIPNLINYYVSQGYNSVDIKEMLPEVPMAVIESAVNALGGSVNPAIASPGADEFSGNINPFVEMQETTTLANQQGDTTINPSFPQPATPPELPSEADISMIPEDIRRYMQATAQIFDDEGMVSAIMMNFDLSEEEARSIVGMSPKPSTDINVIEPSLEKVSLTAKEDDLPEISEIGTATELGPNQYRNAEGKLFTIDSEKFKDILMSENIRELEALIQNPDVKYGSDLQEIFRQVVGKRKAGFSSTSPSTFKFGEFLPDPLSLRSGIEDAGSFALDYGKQLTEGVGNLFGGFMADTDGAQDFFPSERFKFDKDTYFTDPTIGISDSGNKRQGFTNETLDGIVLRSSLGEIDQSLEEIAKEEAKPIEEKATEVTPGETPTTDDDATGTSADPVKAAEPGDDKKDEDKKDADLPQGMTVATENDQAEQLFTTLGNAFNSDANLRMMRNVGKALTQYGNLAEGIGVGSAAASEERQLQEQLDAKRDAELAAAGGLSVGDNEKVLKSKESLNDYIKDYNNAIAAEELTTGILGILSNPSTNITSFASKIGTTVDEFLNFAGVKNVKQFESMKPGQRAKAMLKVLTNRDIKEILGESGRTISNIDRQIAEKIMGSLRLFDPEDSVGTMKFKLEENLRSITTKKSLSQRNIKANAKFIAGYDPKSIFDDIELLMILNDELGYNLQRQSSAQATTPSSNPDDIQLDITGQ
jgi:hypothetical protein